MSDAETERSSQEAERLKQELSRAHGDIDRLKEEIARTKGVQEDLWSHEIYLKARKKMTAGVLAILGILSALGLFTVYDMYKKLSTFTEGKIKTSIQERIETDLDPLFDDAKGALNKQIDAMISDKEAEIDEKIAALLEETIQTAQEEAIAFSERAREIQSAIAPPEVIAPAEVALPAAGARCDPYDLEVSQVDRLGIRHLSMATGQLTRRGEVFQNAFFVDLRGLGEPAESSAEKACVLGGSIGSSTWRIRGGTNRPSSSGSTGKTRFASKSAAGARPA